MKLEGKTAVVTGGASGIGSAVAKTFIAAGGKVIIADINEQAGNDQVKALGSGAYFQYIDITSAQSVSAFTQQVLSTHQVDILVNGAGWGKIEMFVKNDPEFWNKVVDINFVGPMRLTQALLAGMIERKSGRIINIASDAGRVGSTGETAYSGAKGALIGFTKALAREMARHQINVNCVCPGPTETPLLMAVPEPHREALQKAIPMRRFAKASEIADAVLFFASRRSDYITGQILSVSGGLTMNG